MQITLEQYMLYIPTIPDYTDIEVELTSEEEQQVLKAFDDMSDVQDLLKRKINS